MAGDHWHRACQHGAVDRDVTVNGVRLHCVVEGEGPLVVLLHGFPETSRAWRKQIPALAKRFRVVAPDLRGYGGSDKPNGIAASRASVLADDIVGLIHAFEAERAHVVGHDWGGAVAWTVAIEHPEAVDRLAVLNCPRPAVMARALRSNWAQIRRSWYIFAFQLPWLPEWALRRDGARAVKDVLRRAAKPGTFSDADLDEYAHGFSAPGAATAAINYYRAAVRSRASTGKKKISAPTLVIWGEDDIALGIELTRGMDGLFERKPRVEYLPDTGHFVMEERPEVVNRLLLEFLG
ncbi:MAG: alpha/beta fold hydrolase [Chloroflexota bacterium]|nr:alpha/beta fold hydrolase [Chloroflexota bacterium]